MNSTECREKLSRLMSDESQALNELSTLLDREHGFLEANDVTSLDAANKERQKCVVRILQVDEERRALCGATGRPLDVHGLEDLIRWCDPKGTLTAGWAACSAAARRCRQLNERNGALVAARLKHVEARLGTLIDGSRESVTYGPKGAYGTSSSGRVVAIEA